MATPSFSEQPRQPGISRNVLLAAAGVAVLIALILALTTMHRVPRAGAPDNYAPSVTIDKVELSEALNGTGGKVTYIDGAAHNRGGKVLTAATVELRFPADDGSLSAPQQALLTLIRTRIPYVDLEAVSAEPLKSGESHDFRIILENVPANWNQQPPQIRVVRTSTE